MLPPDQPGPYSQGLRGFLRVAASPSEEVRRCSRQAHLCLDAVDLAR